jgi:hypothetical protein
MWLCLKSLKCIGDTVFCILKSMSGFLDTSKSQWSATRASRLVTITGVLGQHVGAQNTIKTSSKVSDFYCVPQAFGLLRKEDRNGIDICTKANPYPNCSSADEPKQVSRSDSIFEGALQGIERVSPRPSKSCCLVSAVNALPFYSISHS